MYSKLSRLLRTLGTILYQGSRKLSRLLSLFNYFAARDA